MTVQCLHGHVACPSARTMAPVWTGWVDTAVTVLLGSPERGVKETSTSATRTPATRPTALTASSCRMITSASASLASQVRPDMIGVVFMVGVVKVQTDANTCGCTYTGQGCQNRFGVCDSQPCKNGGVCSMSSNSPVGYTCTCQLVSLNPRPLSSCELLLEYTIEYSSLFQGYTGLNCERSMSCRELSCYNGGSCTLTPRGARCSCPQGYAGTQCQERANEGCLSKPCRNNGMCREESSFPFFSCQCLPGWRGKRCEQESRMIELPICPLPDCHGKARDGICDKECNSFACHWDGGDCSLAMNPWAHCTDPHCWRVFNNSQCDDMCNTAECLYDNFDCKSKEKVCK